MLQYSLLRENIVALEAAAGSTKPNFEQEIARIRTAEVTSGALSVALIVSLIATKALLTSPFTLFFGGLLLLNIAWAAHLHLRFDKLVAEEKGRLTNQFISTLAVLVHNIWEPRETTEMDDEGYTDEVLEDCRKTTEDTLSKLHSTGEALFQDDVNAAEMFANLKEAIDDVKNKVYFNQSRAFRYFLELPQPPDNNLKKTRIGISIVIYMYKLVGLKTLADSDAPTPYLHSFR